MRTTDPKAKNLIPNANNTRKYSFTPTSVWHISGNKGLEEYKEYVGDKFYNPGLREKGKGAAGVGRKRKYSEFSPLLASQIVEYWSNEDDLILDPFAGRGTRVMVAKRLKRKSVGLDISSEFTSHIKEQISYKTTLFDFEEGIDEYTPSIIRTNSMEMPIKSNSVDFIYTCPPFWNIERYEKHQHQLSEVKEYDIFLEKLGLVLKECYRVLKDGKFIAIVVQDFRLWRKFYAFGAHTTNLLEDAGFSMWDTVIRSYTTNVAVKLPDAKAQKFNVKIHEYVLVGRKEVNALPVFDILIPNADPSIFYDS